MECAIFQNTLQKLLLNKIEEPLLKLLRLSELQRMNSSPISNCQHSKLAILFSRNMNYNINSLLRLLRECILYIYIYIYIYIVCEIIFRNWGITRIRGTFLTKFAAGNPLKLMTI